MYIKSSLAGLAALFALLVLRVLGILAWQISSQVGTGGVFLGLSLVPAGVITLLLLWLMLTAGFYWRFRRASPR
jgi:hypothetical protein